MPQFGRVLPVVWSGPPSRSKTRRESKTPERLRTTASEFKQKFVNASFHFSFWSISCFRFCVSYLEILDEKWQHQVITFYTSSSFLGACQWTMMTCTHAKLDSCRSAWGHEPFSLPLNHFLHDLFFLFAKEKSRNLHFFFFHISVPDMVSSRSSVSLLPQFLICCPAEPRPPDSGKVYFSLHATYFTSSPPSFSNRSPPPPLSLCCLPSLPAWDVFAVPDISFCCCLWPSFTLLCTLPPPPPLPSLQVTAVLPLGSSLCCTTYVSAAFFTTTFSSVGSSQRTTAGK